MPRRIALFTLFLLALVPQIRSAETISPLLNESTFLVLRLDLEKIDFVQLKKDIQKNIEENTKRFATDPAIFDAVTQTLEELVQSLQGLIESLQKEAQAKEIYLYSSTEFFAHSIPCILAVPLAGDSPETAGKLNSLFGKAKLGFIGFPVRFARHGFYFAVPGPDESFALDRMMERQKEGIRLLYRTLRTTDRPEVGQAFAELAGDPIQLVLMRVPMFTASIDMVPWEEVPFLQTDSGDEEEEETSADPFGDEVDKAGSLAAKIRYELREGISWTAFGINPLQRTKWVIQSQGPGGAGRTAETLNALVDQISGWIIEDSKYRNGNQFGQYFESKEELQSLITFFLPKPETEPQKDLLSITLDKSVADHPKIEQITKRIQEQTQKVFGNAKRMQAANQLKLIGLAVHNYHDAYKSLPSASTADANGKPRHSWRVALLPYLEQTALYEAIKHDEPWDSEHNKQFHDRMPSCYASPFLAAEDVKKGLTNYVAITGANAPFPGPNKWNTLARFADGTSNQIMVTECTDAVCWMDPKGDIDFEIAKKGINKVKGGIGSPQQEGVNVLFGDGSVTFFSETTAPKTMEALINVHDGQAVERPYTGFDTRPERPKKVPKLPKPGKATTIDNLKQIALAMHNFHDARRCFPGVSDIFMLGEDKKPRHSWRVWLLPYLGENALYDAIVSSGEPWDSEYSKQNFHNKMPAAYISSGLTPEEIAKGQTTFAVVWGDNAPFQPANKLGFGGISDGLSNTGMIFQRKTSFCWMDPTADIPYESAVKGLDKDDKGIGVPDQENGKKGIYCSAFDGSIHFLPESLDLNSLKAIITPSGNESVAFP